MKLCKRLRKVCLKVLAVYNVCEHHNSNCLFLFQYVIAAFTLNYNLSFFVIFSTICALIPCRGFLIVRVRVVDFLQAFEENSLFSASKTALIES